MNNTLSGYKTYLVALVTAVYGVIAHHKSISTVAPYLLGGAGITTLRVAVAKVEAGIARLEAKLPSPVAAVVDPVVTSVESKV
jgi:hypothetical protein